MLPFMENNLIENIYVDPINEAFEMIKKKNKEIFSSLHVDMNVLYKKNELYKIRETLLPIVLDGHGDLEFNNFIRVPKNYIIITFQKDGRILETISTKQEKTNCQCDNLYFYYIYYWMDFLQEMVLLSRTRRKLFIDTMQENIELITSKLKKLSEFVFKYKTSEFLLQKTYVYYADDLIQDTNIYYDNDEQNVHGITDWKKFMNKCPESKLGLTFNSGHIYKNYSRNLSQNEKKNKKIKLSDFLEYATEKTGLSTKTRKGQTQENITKILFVITCRGQQETVKDLSFTLKSWIQPENPFQYFLKDKMYIERNQLLSRNINLFEIYLDVFSKKKLLLDSENDEIILPFSTFLYKYYSVSATLSNKDLLFIDYQDVVEIQKIFPDNTFSFKGCFIPFRDSNNKLYQLNNNENETIPSLLKKSFYVPNNIVGDILIRFFKNKTLDNVEFDLSFERLFNISSRKYIFEKWEKLIMQYCHISKDYITYMKRKFVYMKPSRIKEKYATYLETRPFLDVDISKYYDYFFYHNYDNLTNLDLWHEMKTAIELNDAIHDKDILIFDFSKLIPVKKEYEKIYSVVYFHSLLIQDFPYFSPFEFAFANYRWVNDNGISVLNELLGKNITNNIEINNVLRMYRDGSKAYMQNFHGKLCDYKDIYKKIIVPMINSSSFENKKMDKLMQTISALNLNNIIKEPYKMFRYIETIPAFDVIYGKYLLDKKMNE